MGGKYVEAGGLRIYYVEEGAGEPIVYVHGNTGSCAWFEKVMSVPGRRAIALDLPNFGRSSPLGGEPSIDLYADAALSFMDALGLKRPVIVAHSLGGAVAISLAARYPKLVAAYLLIDSAAPSGLVTPEAHYPLLEKMRTDRQLLGAALKGVMPTIEDEAFAARLADDAALMAAPAWSGNARALERMDYGQRLSACDAPVLVLWGRKDAIVSEDMARSTAVAFKRSRLEILEGVGHSVEVEDPPRFLTLLDGLLAELKEAKS
jgi:Predicted hydrolases or acyltransferases (alpha/beta hydrolase superfamily)